MKVRVDNVSPKDLQRAYEINLRAARLIYNAKPFVTKTWLKTKFSNKFIDENWDKITMVAGTPATIIVNTDK